ncbi:MAG: hypothetical protein A2X80_11400 [Geobacteraceae bacterium GWB2_52_12]|nr:MAG: hypothetical protein A2X80_11400 [Geobacteraceae bacterium GWB2_52_12]
MARFYDSANDADLMRVEGLLNKKGIVYSLRVLGEGSTLIREIQVAEEDLDAAEMVVCGNSQADKLRTI